MWLSFKCFLVWYETGRDVRWRDKLDMDNPNGWILGHSQELIILFLIEMTLTIIEPSTWSLTFPKTLKLSFKCQPQMFDQISNFYVLCSLFFVLLVVIQSERETFQFELSSKWEFTFALFSWDFISHGRKIYNSEDNK